MMRILLKLANVVVDTIEIALMDMVYLLWKRMITSNKIWPLFKYHIVAEYQIPHH